MRPLTHADKVAAFKAATTAFLRDHGHRFTSGMTDVEIEEALRHSLGAFAGRCGPDALHITWQGSGLKIWASWHIHNHVQEPPLFTGRLTVAMARDTYRIRDAESPQGELF